MAGDAYTRGRVVGQLLLAATTLRGLACSFDRSYVVPVDAHAVTSDAACEEICRRSIPPQDGCSAVMEVESCELGYAPAERKDGPSSGKYAICKMKLKPVMCGAGRRPNGLVIAAREEASMMGARLAEMASLEAASIPAFVHLALELAAHGAPRAFVDAAMESAVDELRHAQIMTRFALAHGAPPSTPTHAPLDVRDFSAMVEENAIEGCLREAIGAKLARVQSERAHDPALRVAMRLIARDEERHARLSRAIDRWARPRLTPRHRRRIDERVNAMLTDLLENFRVDRDRLVDAELGLPSMGERAFIARGVA